MRVEQSVVVFLSFGLAVSFTACKRTPPPPVAAAPAPEPKIDAAKLTDEQLVAASLQDGLGLGLRIPGNGTFTTSQAIPLHVVLEDFDQKTPIASGLCGGFYLIYQDVATQDYSSGQLTLNQRCFDAEPYPDLVPLSMNKLVAVDANTTGGSHIEFAPGKYLFSVEWHAFPAGPGTIGEREAVTTLRSNAVPVTLAAAPPHPGISGPNSSF